MHRRGREVQVPRKTDGTVRRRLASSPAQYQEGKAGVWAAWEATLKGGGRAESLEFFYRVLVQEVLLIGSETWVLPETMRQRIQGAHVSF